MKTKKQFLRFTFLACLALAGAAAHAAEIVSDTFTTPGLADFATIEGRTPETNLPGGTWVTKFGEPDKSFLSTIAAGHGNPIPGTFGGVAQNVSAVSIASAGAYVKPTRLTISADLAPMNNAGAAAGGRGIALGFYSSLSSTTEFSQNLFTGLVLDSLGNLNLVNDPNATGFFGGGLTPGTAIAFVGSWDANALRRLTYTVDTVTGAISDISLEGSSATYSFTTSLFTDAATHLAGVYTSSETGAASAMDNFRVVTANLIASETFTGSGDGVSIEGTTLDTSRSGGTWVTKFGEPDKSFLSTTTAGYGNPIPGSFGHVMQNVSAVSIASAGAYVKPTLLIISADLAPRNNGGEAAAGRGIALGFYSSLSSTTMFSQNLFTGLVLDAAGNLNLVNDPNANGFFDPGSTLETPIAFVGTWDANALRRLTYTVNTVTGAISDISLEGSSATYSFTTSLFTDAATHLAGVYTSSETAAFSAMDNFRVEDGSVPPGGNTFADWIAGYSGVGGQTGFAQDPDGDGIPNGVEAWFGTHPGEFSQGIIAGSKSGNAFTFTHPQNLAPPSDLTGFYQWSRNLIDWYAGNGVDGPPAGPTVTLTPATTGTTTTVTATASEAMEKMFLRAGASQN